MAPDHRQAQARRVRNARRQVQKTRTRKRWMRAVGLLVGLGLFVTGGVLIFAGGAPEAPTLPPDDLPDTTVIHLAAAGDLNITDDVIASAVVDGNFSTALMDVAGILSAADLAVMNFEGTFSGEPYGKGTMSAPASLAKALKRSGVDLLQLANSYSISNGVRGLISTIDTVRAAGLEPLGVYRNKEEAAEGKGVTLVEAQGIKIAFVAFTKGMDGMALPGGSEGCVNVLYQDYDSTYQKINTEGIRRTLSAANEAGADLVVAMLHWGSEYNDTISPSQERICQLMMENGVDVIIGTHPHFVHKMEFQPEQGTFIAYSLGDFFGDGIRAGTEYSVILDLEITKNNRTGQTKVTGYSYTPVFTLRETARILRVVRIEEAMLAYENNYADRISKENYNRMKYALTRIEARIQGE